MDKLDDRIRALAEQKGFREADLRPWQWSPWEVSGPCPFPSAQYWNEALALRAELIAELEATSKPKPKPKRRR
jgi:hypothetical protein